MIKIKTELLKSMLVKSSRVCSFDKMLPLTELMEIRTDGENLEIVTTDKLTNLMVKGKIEGNQESMRVVVNAKLFNSLIDRMTTEYIELTALENSLMVSGNGVYYLEIGTDETGEVIKFPEVKVDETKPFKEFSYKDLAAKLAIAAPATPENIDEPSLVNFYLKEDIIATNAFRVTAVKNIDIMKNEELFITKRFGLILIDLAFDKGKFYIVDNIITIFGDNYIIQSSLGDRDHREKYPLTDINNMLNQAFTYKVVVDKNIILSILDRLSLFVTEYDSNNIDLSFSKDRLKITSVKKTADEDIKYITAEVTDLAEFNCSIGINDLKQQLSVLPDDQIEIRFGGSDNAIGINDGEIREIVCLKD